MTVLVLALIAIASAKPLVVSPYTAAYLDPAIVTATSSQYIARNYNGYAAGYVAAPEYVSSPYIASPFAYSGYNSFPASYVL